MNDSEEIVKVVVPQGHGCKGCHYDWVGHTFSECDHPDPENRNCSKLEFRDGTERIYLPATKAALFRLRGTI